MFDWLKKKMKASRPPEIRDALFGDKPLEEWPPDSSESGSAQPWDSFISVRKRLESKDRAGAIQLLRDIVGRQGLEARHYVQGWHFLRQLGVAPEPAIAKQVLGVVVEVGMSQGLDLLAAYVGNSARYFNYSGNAVIWDASDASLDPYIQRLLTAGQNVADAIGPWDKDRPPAPPSGQVRLSMLTPSGLHFGQGPFEALANDDMGGPVIQAATQLMQQLIAKAEASRA